MTSPDSTDFTLGVVGAGLMGGGIAQVAAQAGIRTLLFDTQIGASVRGKQNIAAMLQRLAAKGKMSDEAVTKALDNVQPVDTLTKVCLARDRIAVDGLGLVAGDRGLEAR